MITTLTPSEQDRIVGLAKTHWGLSLHDGKSELIARRVSMMIDWLGIGSVQEYLEALDADRSGQQLLHLFDALSTNTTSFFRESDHFDFLAEHFYRTLSRNRPERRLRIWSAACSTGAEPYTISMHLQECVPDLDRWDLRILATDLCADVLETATRAEYEAREVEPLGEQRVRRFFEPARRARGAIESYRVRDRVRAPVSVHRLNLLESWPMRGPFDVIFLRNVMIYFENDTRTDIIRRMAPLLAPDGYLIVGSAETLTGLDVPFRAVRPSIHQLVERA